MPRNELRRLVPAALVVLAGVVLAGPLSAPAWAEPAAKKVVKTADDLPRHTYKIDGKASAFIDDTAKMGALMTQLRKDLESALAEYDIQDPTTLQGYLSSLQSIALLEGRDQDALSFIDRIKELETKQAQKLVTGTVQRAVVASRAVASDRAAATLKAELDKQLRALPFDKIREIIKSRKSQMEIATADLVRGQLQSQLDPVVESTNGEISSDIARQMVQLAFALRVVLPNRVSMLEVYTKLLADNTTEARDIWQERAANLSESAGLTPVVVGVWDSGVDTSIFTDRLFTNAAETPNGKDDDNNGFIDDLHGIAFNLDAQPVPSLLFPMDNLKTPLETIQKHSAGMSDLQSNIDSPEARAARDYIRSLKPEDVGTFLEDLGQWGNYMHGTHVAGIAAEGNPAARILTARIEFDYRNIPLHAPSVERAKTDAAAAQKSVDYFKAHGVRVVNMSWGGSREDIENALEQKGVGKTAEERAAMSREIFGIMKDGLDAAIKSAPDILFIAAAGNSNNDSQFSEMVPSGLTAPNMITIGAVDQSGKPTGFTTFGKNVALYASGYQVDSYVPGGKRERASGTSMAAPQVANLAGKLFAIDPKLTADDAVKLITKTADPMPGENPGRFLINPKNAVEEAIKARD
ncbi:MAG: S8 family serine peptidase [Phycisphaerales bacterium]